MSLRDALSAMGLGALFDGSADLSGLLSTPTPIAVSDVLHSVKIKVDEAGTRAAAATAVMVQTTSAVVSPTFTADRPFLFLIRDTRNGAILFMGRVADPRR
jgi:serpin B